MKLYRVDHATGPYVGPKAFFLSADAAYQHRPALLAKYAPYVAHNRHPPIWEIEFDIKPERTRDFTNDIRGLHQLLGLENPPNDVMRAHIFGDDYAYFVPLRDYGIELVMFNLGDFGDEAVYLGDRRLEITGQVSHPAEPTIPIEPREISE